MLRLLALALLLGLLGGGYYYWKVAPGTLPPRNVEQAKQQLKDVALTGAVKTALSLHKRLEPHAIGVSTEDGVVTLRGELPSQETKQAALRVAAAVPDVRQVVDHLKLDETRSPAPEPSDGRTLGERLDDETLAARARMAFALDRSLKDAPLRVESWKKELRLSGSVPSEAVRRLAVQAAGEVAGVRGVRSAITVAGSREAEGEADAERRRAAVEKAIRANPNLAQAQIRVQLEQGAVVLEGHVSSGAERDLAALLARDAGGEVRNGLVIRR